MTHLRDLTIKSFHEGLLNKDFSALEIVRATFSHIENRDKEIGAYLDLHKDEAMTQASRVDVAVAEGGDIHPLAGVPIAIKDNILIEGTRTTAASKILKDYSASYDATVVKKLKETQVVFLGKTNLDEFAMGSSTENSGFQLTRNPHDTERVPGGSSGGSAAAVAANMAVAALGSDTSGSVRQPAAFCGAVGLKPTYGAVSRFGLIAMASSLDQIGPITKTVEDAIILFKAIRGKDNFDATSVNPPAGGEYRDELLNPPLENVRKLRIGVPKEYFIDGLDPMVEVAIRGVINKLETLKLEFKEISLPHTKYTTSCYYIIMPAELSTNLARFDGIRYGTRNEGREIKNLIDLYKSNRGEGFGEEARRRILLGAFVLSAGYYEAYYAKAQKVRRLVARDFDEAFKDVDVILTPSTPTPAFKIGEKVNDPIAMYLSDVFTGSVNLAGLPAISIPVKKYELSDGELPISFQLIGRHFREADILGIGQYYERL
ncbi:MAG: Asp-tRNA(Asn)/Glu-tRNA(Gln) amidotransferase subunit GatA [Patescibacteria group bacterium]|nr:Asp-tRNA(Asn)/Glu-tRNA(Gln) amidotransferase subunit GatA [Patescibacteria group bacterium]